VAALTHTATVDILYGCLAGVINGCGFFCYFTAVDVIPSTISFAISNCSPLVTITIDVVLLGHLKFASSKQSGFMGLAVFFFIGGIILLIVANNS
jgi:drug/metabolite transporter (DMT)-like permease